MKFDSIWLPYENSPLKLNNLLTNKTHHILCEYFDDYYDIYVTLAYISYYPNESEYYISCGVSFLKARRYYPVLSSRFSLDSFITTLEYQTRIASSYKTNINKSAVLKGLQSS